MTIDCEEFNQLMYPYRMAAAFLPGEVKDAYNAVCDHIDAKLAEKDAQITQLKSMSQNEPVNIPFDLERARAGEKVQIFAHNITAWRDVHFAGVSQSNEPIIEDGILRIVARSNLRMKPKPVKEM